MCLKERFTFALSYGNLSSYVCPATYVISTLNLKISCMHRRNAGVSFVEMIERISELLATVCS